MRVMHAWVIYMEVYIIGFRGMDMGMFFAGSFLLKDPAGRQGVLAAYLWACCLRRSVRSCLFCRISPVRRVFFS